MNPSGNRFRDAVCGVGLFLTGPDLHHTRFVLHHLSNGFPAEPPLRRQFPKAEMAFKSCVLQSTASKVYCNVNKPVP